MWFLEMLFLISGFLLYQRMDVEMNNVILGYDNNINQVHGYLLN